MTKRPLPTRDHRCLGCDALLHWSEPAVCDRCERTFAARKRRWQEDRAADLRVRETPWDTP